MIKYSRAKILTLIFFFTCIFANQYLVTVEVFTETWWPYCPDARAGVQELYNNHAYVIPLIWQGNSEQESPNYSMRASQYGVSGIPHVEFGGTISSIGGGGNMYPTYLGRYNQLVNFNSPLQIDLTTTTIGEQVVTTADIEVTGTISTVNNKF